MKPLSATSAIVTVTVLVLGVGGCNTKDPPLQAQPSEAALAASSAAPLDHLLPGELSESSQLAFGFPVPRGMRIERAFPDALHLIGEVSMSGLTDYVRKHARVSAPELTGALLRFDRARIPSQGDARLYRFELSQRGKEVQLLVRDITPATLQPGLSEEERWRQAGLKPNGQPLNVSDLR